MKNKIVTVIAVSFLISACSNSKNKNYNFIKGLNDYQKQDKVSALENYKKAYEKDDRNIILTNEIAYLYIDLGNFDEAEKYLKRTLIISPNNEYALRNLMQIFYMNKNIDEMQQYLPQILDKNSFLFNLTNLRIAILQNNKFEIEKYLEKINFNNDFLKEYDSGFYQDLEKIMNLTSITKNISKEILEKTYKNFSKTAEKYREITKIYASFLIENKDYEKAEEVLLKYMVNSQENDQELKLLEKLYKEQNNLEKLKNLNNLQKKREGK